MEENKPYKVVETQAVTDSALEEIINDAVQQGWQLDGIHFAMRDSSRRPAMAFVLFQNPNFKPEEGEEQIRSDRKQKKLP